VLARGGEKSADRSVRVEFEKIPEYEGDVLRDPLRFLFTAPDFVFLCGTLVSLAIILLAYDSMAREREHGTLQLMLSGPVSRSALVLGKWCGGLLSMLIPYAAASLLIAGLILFDPVVAPDAADLVRIVVLLALGAVFVAVVFSGTLLISVLASSSSVSAVVLHVVWALLVLAIPSAAGPLGHLLTPGASVDRSEAQAMEIFQGRHKVRLAGMLARFDMPRRTYQSLSDEEKFELETKQWQIFEEEALAILEVSREYRRNLDRVDRTATWINRLSPYGCFQNACLAVANTGPGHERNLFLQNQRYQHELLEYMMREGGRKALESFRPTDMPEYRLQARGVAASLAASFMDIALLCLMGAACFMVCYRVFVRRDVVA
jgi:ABC-type transport system involved in multi-copper enzyme maturation permease subunit